MPGGASSSQLDDDVDELQHWLKCVDGVDMDTDFCGSQQQHPVDERISPEAAAIGAALVQTMSVQPRRRFRSQLFCRRGRKGQGGWL